MNDLEHAMADLADWAADRRAELGEARLSTLCAWLLKTYIIFTVLDDGVRRFLSSDDVIVVPEATRARQLFSGQRSDAFRGVTFGVARADRPGVFEYRFGNPAVYPRGPSFLNARSAGAAVITVGNLHLWIAMTTVELPQTQVRLPRHVLRPRPDLRSGELRLMHKAGSLDDVIVNYGAHDAATILGA